MKIPKGLIVSVQVELGSAFSQGEDIVKFCKEAVRGGCVGLRLCGSYNVRMVKKYIKVPIIGLTKSSFSDGTVYITPTYEDAIELIHSGADFVAMDATNRCKYKELEKATNQGNIIGDISNFKEALVAIESGCCALTTALSGYTSDCNKQTEPDYSLVHELVESFPSIPILAEGRYWENSQVKKAFNLGAYSVVVGSAISRPHLITERLGRT